MRDRLPPARHPHFGNLSGFKVGFENHSDDDGYGSAKHRCRRNAIEFTRSFADEPIHDTNLHRHTVYRQRSTKNCAPSTVFRCQISETLSNQTRLAQADKLQLIGAAITEQLPPRNVLEKLNSVRRPCLVLPSVKERR
jgi:hypothetical protein